MKCGKRVIQYDWPYMLVLSFSNSWATLTYDCRLYTYLFLYSVPFLSFFFFFFVFPFFFVLQALWIYISFKNGGGEKKTWHVMKMCRGRAHVITCDSNNLDSSFHSKKRDKSIVLCQVSLYHNLERKKRIKHKLLFIVTIIIYIRTWKLVTIYHIYTYIWYDQ